MRGYVLRSHWALITIANTSRRNVQANVVNYVMTSANYVTGLPGINILLLCYAPGNAESNVCGNMTKLIRAHLHAYDMIWRTHKYVHIYVVSCQGTNDDCMTSD